MLKRLLDRLSQSSNDSFATRRQFDRRSGDRCIGVVKGRNCPVRNWSPGGALMESDERLFSEGEEVGFTLKFKLGDTIMDIAHRGQIVRKSNGKIALKFSPPTDNMMESFHAVMEHQKTAGFAG